MPNGEIPYKACMPYQDTNSIVIPRFLANIREHPKFGDEYRPIDLMRYRDATVGWLNSKRISTKNQRRGGGNLDDLGFFVDKAPQTVIDVANRLTILSNKILVTMREKTVRSMGYIGTIANPKNIWMLQYLDLDQL